MKYSAASISLLVALTSCLEAAFAFSPTSSLVNVHLAVGHPKGSSKLSFLTQTNEAKPRLTQGVVLQESAAAAPAPAPDGAEEGSEESTPSTGGGTATVSE